MKSMTLAVAVALAATLAGNAQSRNPNELPTNLSQATTFATPPAGFSPLTASDERLADYGFPPRPDQLTAPSAYASWAKAMLASQRRIVPIVQQTSIFHGPTRPKSLSPATQGSELVSGNWSGYGNTNGATRYGSTAFSVIATDVVVPTAQEAFGACSANGVYGSSWVGMDGINSGDVLQAGIEFDAACYGGIQETFYSPWFEWYPSGSMRIINLPISAGDDVYVEVWNTSPTQGYAYLVNENANAAVTISFQAPAGTRLIGNSAEWITERPSVDGALATLTNYIADPFWNAYGATFSKRAFNPGSSEAIVMLDDNGFEVSSPTLLGDAAFITQNTGSSR